jgi:diadenosine tetraphosphatase ApaH/serine/threonine PP2A family protein phosphatase
LLPSRRWVAIIGAVGQARDGVPAANYALLDERRSTLTFWRVPYDFEAAAQKIRRAGLPERLATRLEQGR